MTNKSQCNHLIAQFFVRCLCMNNILKLDSNSLQWKLYLKCVIQSDTQQLTGTKGGDTTRSVSAPYSTNPYDSNKLLIKGHRKCTYHLYKDKNFIKKKRNEHDFIHDVTKVSSNSYLVHQMATVLRVMDPLNQVGLDRGLWCADCC